jgi:cellulose synthase/poly-beta-1,6-N-acetylglucosamine synthase-like glycosyltransferase
MTWVFWMALVCLVYAYAGFPLLLWLRARLFPRPHRAEDYTPSVSVVIAAYNEAAHIAARIENLLSQDYPTDHLEIIVASDGSADQTNEIVESYGHPNVQLLALPRQGKGPALNAAAAAASGEFLVFTDANTHFRPDAVRQLARHFADPFVGGVAGNQIYLRGERASSTADGERLYWNFDQWLKSLQSRGGSVTSATGAIYAIRRSLYQDIPADAMDDFYISTGVVQRGYRLVFAPAAQAFEPVAEAEGVEFARKLRVITQGLQAVIYRHDLLNPFRYGFYAWQLFSHKVLRRLVGVPLLVMAITCPALYGHGWVYQLALAMEVAFFLLFAAAFFLRGTSWGNRKPLAIAWYFVMVNTAALVSAIAILRGHRVRRWEPERHQAAPRDEPMEPVETVAG